MAAKPGHNSKFYMKEHDDFNFTCAFSSQYNGNASVSDIRLGFAQTQVDDSVILASTDQRVLADRVEYSIKAMQAEWSKFRKHA